MWVPGEAEVDDFDSVARPRHAQDVLRLKEKHYGNKFDFCEAFDFIRTCSQIWAVKIFSLKIICNISHVLKFNTIHHLIKTEPTMGPEFCSKNELTKLILYQRTYYSHILLCMYDLHKLRSKFDVRPWYFNKVPCVRPLNKCLNYRTKLNKIVEI